MFKRRKSILCLLIAVLMMASASTAAMAASPYETRYNNTVMASSVASISESGLLTVDNQFQGIRGKTTKGEITTYDVTLGEIQQELIDYASIAGSKIVPGTDSYYDYVVNQLLNHSDQKLCEHPHYDLVEYL